MERASVGLFRVPCSVTTPFSSSTKSANNNAAGWRTYKLDMDDVVQDLEELPSLRSPFR
jgi:hypothetical protein